MKGSGDEEEEQEDEVGSALLSAPSSPSRVHSGTWRGRALAERAASAEAKGSSEVTTRPRREQLPGDGIAKSAEEALELSSQDHINPKIVNWKSVAGRWLAKQNKHIQPELTKARKRELRDLFKTLDIDGGGTLDKEELVVALQLCGEGERAPVAVDRMFRALQKNPESGEMNFSEFAKSITRTQQASSSQGGEDVSFQLILQTFRRKRLMEQTQQALREGPS